MGNLDSSLFHAQREKIYKRWPTSQDVKNDLCPECPFKTGFCQWLLSIESEIPDSRSICKGMMMSIQDRRS